MINKILNHQAEFISSTARHTGLVGGYRSGKSQAGVFKTVAKKMQMPNVDCAYYLPTYGLIKDVAFPKFKDVLDANGMKYQINKSDKDIITKFGRIILRSMDNPDSIIGYEVGYSLIDEADILSKPKMFEIMKMVLARNSVKSVNTNNCTDFVSTPEGFNFLYDFFVKKDSKNKKLIKASTKDNPFISESYIESLNESYTENQLKSYLNGEFVNLTSGSVYHSFDRDKNHSDREIKNSDVLHIGMDFNITNMSATFRVSDGNTSTAIDEITEAYDTAEMIDIINKKYPNHKKVIYPDASGAARKTAGGSDLKLLREAKFIIRNKKKNPKVRDRITTANRKFLNSKGKAECFVNTNNCPNLTEAYEQLAYKNDVPDKNSGHDHITDADTYCIFGINHKTKVGRAGFL